MKKNIETAGWVGGDVCAIKTKRLSALMTTYYLKRLLYSPLGSVAPLRENIESMSVLRSRDMLCRQALAALPPSARFLLDIRGKESIRAELAK